MSQSPIWSPSKTRRAQCNMSDFAASRAPEGVSDYAALYAWSVENIEDFWAAIWEEAQIVHSAPYENVLDPAMPGAIWMSGARLNFAENLLRHDGDDLALLALCEHRPPQRLSFAQLRHEVARCAEGLRAAGVTVGDRVAGYLPNVAQSVIAMLAATSLGAIWSSCSPDFGLKGVLDRFCQIEPRVLFVADGYQYGGKPFSVTDRVRQITEALPSLEQVVLIPFLSDQPDLSGIHKIKLWSDFLPDSPPPLRFEQLPFDHPVYILYSSGTTGVPKCLVHGAGGTLLQHAKELMLHCDLRRGDNIFYYTTCGWMMWNWLVSALMVGATVTLYDGSPAHPDLNRLWDIIDEHQLTLFGTSPKFLGTCRSQDLSPRTSHSLASLKTVLSTGAPLLPEDFDWVYAEVKQDLQLCSISGGTDLISCFALGSPMLPVYRGQLQCRGLGMAVEAFDADGKPVRGAKGELVCTQPFPSMPVSFWNDPGMSRYRRAYFERFEGVWTHGDYVEITEEDGVIIYGRSDATLNPGGVRIGTAEIYRQVETMEEVLDSLAVGQPWQDDVRIVLFVILQPGIQLDDSLRDKIKRRIKSGATPRHVPARILQVSDVPYTISGKKVELAVSQIIQGTEPANKDALKNPEALALYRDLAALRS